MELDQEFMRFLRTRRNAVPMKEWQRRHREAQAPGYEAARDAEGRR